MKLNDLRRLTVREHIRVRFRTTGGLECVINEHGIGKTPELKGPPDFNLEDEFGKASDFVMERAKTPPRAISRAELEALASSGVAAATESDHED